jgi:lipopolysaccharide biosynthesis glycosyltransferase
MIELACIADGSFVRHAGAMLHSAFECSPHSRFSVHVLHSAPIDDADRRNLKAVAAAVASSLDFLEIPAGDVGDLPEGYFPRSVWFRILLPELLPHAERVLYLDSDLIVTDDLQPLWDIDLDGCLLAAVTNPLYPFMPPYPAISLGIPNASDYFNSGVLLMDLGQMRAEDTTSRLRQYATRHPGNHFPDQDALNVVCRHRRLSLHPRWNVQSSLYELRTSELPFPTSEIEEARAHPAIIHFIGPFKPWQYLCRHPHQSLYFDHAAATPWGAPALEGRTPRTIVLRRLPLAWIDRWMAWERESSPYFHRLRGLLGRWARVATGRRRRRPPFPR